MLILPPHRLENAAAIGQCTSGSGCTMWCYHDVPSIESPLSAACQVAGCGAGRMFKMYMLHR